MVVVKSGKDHNEMKNKQKTEHSPTPALAAHRDADIPISDLVAFDNRVLPWVRAASRASTGEMTMTIAPRKPLPLGMGRFRRLERFTGEMWMWSVEWLPIIAVFLASGTVITGNPLWLYIAAPLCGIAALQLVCMVIFQ